MKSKFEIFCSIDKDAISKDVLGDEPAQELVKKTLSQLSAIEK